MLEESAMEKKPSVRSGQGPSKGSCTESKKAQDATNGKQFPRNGRKRESPSSYAPKPDQSRKPLPQKSKALDKRPKPRGLHYGSGKENSQIEEYEAEIGSILAPGSKKQSLNHLLNFHLEPRGDNVPKRSQPSQNATKPSKSNHVHKYNKEQFLQANCQFVVREDGDYTFNLSDADLLVDWDFVELIITGSCDKIICPICLYPPVAGKITRCGHVFCWSCVLHYLALSDKTWRKCPICYESIHKNNLKSVECVEKALYSVGERITMRLMKREKGTLVATPVNQFSARTSKPILSYGEKELDTVYSKLLIISHDNILQLISREYAELQSQVDEFQGCPELCFVQQALSQLEERKNQLEMRMNGETPAQEDTPQDENTQHLSKEEEVLSPSDTLPRSESIPITSNLPETLNHRISLRYTSESTSSEGDELTNMPLDDLEADNSQKAQFFYFYQASDGQHIYLHNINIRMLEMTYGSLENCPPEISGVIVEKESDSMMPDIRKRLRYLQHVPITCEFEMVELEMHPPLISEEAFIQFQDKVEERQRRRQRQARAEKRREKKIEEEERKQFKRGPALNVPIESFYHFPQCGTDEFPRVTPSVTVPVTSHSSRSSSPSSHLEENVSPLSSSVAALSIDSEDGPSFAQMLREGKTMASGEAWPAIGGLASPVKSNPISSANPWRRHQRQESISHDPVDSDNDALFSPPARPSFNIAEAIQMAASFERGESNGGRKKKKKQQKLLFSTGVPKGN